MTLFKTHTPKDQLKSEKKWYLIDAEGQVLGRLATKIAVILRGKNKPDYSPHMDRGDYIVVINADKIRVTGTKEEAKEYIHHTGYPGGIKRAPLGKLRQENPRRILLEAVAGMFPHNRLKKPMLEKLKIFAGVDHGHIAQNPEPLAI